MSISFLNQFTQFIFDFVPFYANLTPSLTNALKPQLRKPKLHLEKRKIIQFPFLFTHRV